MRPDQFIWWLSGYLSGFQPEMDQREAVEIIDNIKSMIKKIKSDDKIEAAFYVG